MRSFTAEDLAAEVLVVLDDVADNLQRAIADAGVTEAAVAREARIGADALREFIGRHPETGDRKRASIMLSTLVRACIVAEVPIEIRIGSKARRRAARRITRRSR